MSDPEWPADNRPADIEAITGPICKAIRFAYSMRRRNADQDIPYDGLDIGEDDQANALRARHQLSAEQLAYSDQDQGRDALTEIVGLAIRLGIEQGRRIIKNGSEYQTLEILADVGKLLVDRELTKHK